MSKHKRMFDKRIIAAVDEMRSEPRFRKTKWFVDCSGEVRKCMIRHGGKVIPCEYYKAVFCEGELRNIHYNRDGISYMKTFHVFEDDYEKMERSVIAFDSIADIDRAEAEVRSWFEKIISEEFEGIDLLESKEEDHPIELAKALSRINDELFNKLGIWECPSIKFPYELMEDGDSYSTELFQKYEGNEEMQDIIAEAIYAAERFSERGGIRICELGKNFIPMRF